MLACEVLGVWVVPAALGPGLKDGPRVPSSCSPRNGLIQGDGGGAVERPCAGLCLSVSVFLTLSLCFSMCDILCLCVYNSVHLSRCLSPSASISIFVCLSVYRSLSVYLCLSDFISLSFCL